jgi:hypothetical protein
MMFFIHKKFKKIISAKKKSYFSQNQYFSHYPYMWQRKMRKHFFAVFNSLVLLATFEI